MIPLLRIDRARSSIRPSSICVRGWNLLGRSRSVSISSARSDGAGAGTVSGMSALRPRPSAGRFSTMVLLRLWGGGFAGQHFFREGKVGFGAARLHVVEDRRHAVARRFAESDVARDHGGVDAILEEFADVARYLLPQIRTL